MTLRASASSATMPACQPLTASILLMACAMLSVACTPSPTTPDLDIRSLSSPEALAPIGMNREDVRRRGSLGWEFLRGTQPADEFARLTVRQMVGQRKARPISYERFVLPTTPGVRHTDYVFYDSQNRIIYVARKTDRD